MKIQKILLTVWLITGMVTIGKAQQQKTDTVGTGKLSGAIGISKERAIEIKAAFNYNRDKLDKLIQENTVPAAQKMKQLTVLLAERRNHIAVLNLTREQEGKLKQEQAEGLQKNRALQEQMLQENGKAMRKLAIQVTAGASRTDTLKSGNSPR